MPPNDRVFDWSFSDFLKAARVKPTLAIYSLLLFQLSKLVYFFVMLKLIEALDFVNSFLHALLWRPLVNDLLEVDNDCSLATPSVIKLIMLVAIADFIRIIEPIFGVIV